MDKKVRKKVILVTIIYILISVIILTLGLGAIAAAKRENKRQDAFNYGKSISSSIQLVLENTTKSAETLKYFYLKYGDSLSENFDEIAAEIMLDNPVIGSLYIAPNGVLQMAYPESVKSSTIGFDCLHDPDQGPRCQLAVDTGKITVAGPHNLVEGGVGFIIRDPIFKNRSFIGLSVIVLDWDKCIDEIMNAVEYSDKYKFAVWKDDHDENAVTDADGFILRNTNTAISNEIDIEFEVPNDSWHLLVEPVDGWTAWQDMILEIVVAIITDLLLLLTIVTIVGSNERKRQLKAMTDQQENLERLGIIKSLSDIYTSCYYISLKDNSFVALETDSIEIQRKIGSAGNASEKFQLMCDEVIAEECKAMVREFVDLSTIYDRLRGKRFITCQFNTIMGRGWFEGIFIPADINDECEYDHLIWAIRSIDEQKQKEIKYENELVEARDKAEAANRAKSHFLSNMSHDLRTPMNAILGFSKLMEDHTGEPDVIEDYLNKIEGSGEYLLSIINNILDMARIDSGKMELDENIVDIENDEINALHMLESQFRQKNQIFSQEIDIRHRHIIADKARMNQIIVNLLSNASKYTPDGGHIKLSVREEECERQGYGKYIISVTDDGIGMSQEFMDTIFDAFTRERTTTESKVIGTGLGMAIVKKIVDLMDGSIELESELGKGSSFRVTLIHKLADNPENDDEGIEKKNQTNIAGRRFLLAEDNDLNAEIAEAILNNLGVEIDRARDGVEAVDMLTKAPAGYYSLVLMDIQMPNLNGYLATKKIRKLPDLNKARIPIIAMTANAFEEDKQKAYEAGMNGHVAKPIDVNNLIATLNSIIKK